MGREREEGWRERLRGLTDAGDDGTLVVDVLHTDVVHHFGRHGVDPLV